MRFFEFLQSNQNNTISNLVDIVKDPDVDPQLKKDILAIFQQLKLKDNPEEKQNEALDNNESELVSEIEDDEAYYQRVLNTDSRLKAIAEKKIKDAADPDTVFEKISAEFKELLDKRTDLNPAVREVFIKELFDYIRVNKQTDLVKQFLNDCVSGNGPIDMPNIVKTEGPGNLVEKSSPYFNILLKLAKTNPGSGNAASGQGEYMLVLAGKDTKKINPGDIGVEKEKIEVKSSDLKGKSSYTDFVLSSDKLPVAQAKSYFVSEINKILGRQEIESGTATSGGISALNDKTIRRLNPIFQEVNSKKPGAMQEIMKGLWKTVYPDSQLEQYVDSVVDAVNDDGTLELTKLYGPTAVLSAAAYKLSNTHDALLMLNIPDLSYIVVRDPDKMSEIFEEGAVELGMTSIFDFRSNPGAPTFIKKFRQSNKT